MVRLNRMIVAGFIAFDPRIGEKAGSFTLNFVQGHLDRAAWDSVKVVAFGTALDRVRDLRKGDAVVVEGQFQLSRWDKDGVPQVTPQIVAVDVQVGSFERPRLPINGRAEGGER